MTTSPSNEPINFENSFARLEAILERMNSNTISLDESLQLFEEADKLISHCNQRLSEAETRVEMLIKARNGDLTLDADQKPVQKEVHKL